MVPAGFKTDHNPIRYYSIRWLIIVVLGLLVYAQTFAFGFVFDDHLFIVTNPYIKDFSNLATIWKSFPLTRFVGMYTFALNYCWGQLDPRGYHIFNFVVHLAATGMVWLTAGYVLSLARKARGVNDRPEDLGKDLPYVVALLFLVHPGQTQAVAYITQRFESMATVFYLGTVYGYLRARTASAVRPRIGFLIVSVLCGLWGMMTKEVMFTVPLTILAAEWILIAPLKNVKGVRPLVTCAILAVAGAALAVAFTKLVHNDLSVFSLKIDSASHDGDVFTFSTYVLTQMRVFLTFLRLLVLPVGQNLDYDFPMSTGVFSPPTTLLGIAVIAVMVTAVVRLRHRVPAASFGVAWMLITFSVNLVPRQNAIFEHKLYLISFGFLLAFAAALGSLRLDRKVALIFWAGVIAVFSVMTFSRNQVWKNEGTLWEDIYRKSPNKSRVNANLGRVYGAQKRYEEAIRFLTRAIELKPDDNISRLNRGLLFHEIGRDDLALPDLEKSLAIDPYYFPTLNARAMVFMDQHRDAEALKDLQASIRTRPGQPDAYLMRGSLWMRQGKDDQALADFNVVLKISPHEYGALLNRGAVYYRLGRYQQALEDFTRADRIVPSETTRNNIALCLTALGRSR